MKEADNKVILGGIMAAVLAGLWAQFMGLETAVDGIIDYFVVITTLIGLYFLNNARKDLGGEIARSLEILGIATFLYVISYWPSYRWGMAGNPAWLGMTAEFWSMLFSLLNMMTFGLIAYGFYRFWTTGKN
jgi:hypothetical protein